MNIKGVLLLGVVIHTTFIISIFDIYFKSPIINGITPINNKNGALSKRVVFISVDGLRIDSLFDKDPITGNYVAPYVRNIIESRGSWGMSESHLPTESRPGHVAMLAGFYEDPSAVMKGWKQNPVDFDSLFNQSRCTFAWGSPDIVPIFSKNLDKHCLYVDTYDEADQKFSGVTTEFDNWVYTKLFEFLSNTDTGWEKELKQSSTFFFLHLLGQDTSGHTDKPHTDLYRRNLKNVDTLIEKIEKLLKHYYKDDDTTFIITSDHGMTDWGSHGAGHDSETRTPFVAWGRSIKTPEAGYSYMAKNWGLSHLNMKNIEQADITPLVSVLLGISVPTNSIGLLPYQYLNTSQQLIAKSIFLNAKQMSNHFLRKLEVVEKQGFRLFYKEFINLNKSSVEMTKKLIENDILAKKFVSAIDRSKKLINDCLNGLDYYHNYYQRFLFLCITLCYVSWSMLLVLKLFYDIPLLPVFTLTSSNITFCMFVILSVLMINMQNLPILYNIYIILPQYLLFVLLSNFILIKSLFDRFIKTSLIFFIFYLICIEMLVISFFSRWVLSILMIVLVIWEYVLLLKEKTDSRIMWLWLFSGFGLSIFPLLPIIGRKSEIMTVLLSGLMWVIFSIIYSVKFVAKTHKRTFLSIFTTPLYVATVCNLFNVYTTFKQVRELSSLSQMLSIILCVVSFISLFISSIYIFERLYFVIFTLSIPFLLMCVNHEGFFLLLLAINLFCWIYLEHTSSSQCSQDNLLDYQFVSVNQTSYVTSNHFRLSFYLISYICVGFFGIGNIASLNSFDPSWVRCFVTTFSPFTMTALILFKTIVPFLIIICFLKAVTVVTNRRIDEILTIVLVYCNVMGLNFLYLVTNKGSWLDIGTSISHYIIQQTTVLFLVLLYVVCHVITTFQLPLLSKLFDVKLRRKIQ